MVRPSIARALSDAMRLVQQTYARPVNKREGWTGALWQGRYKSVRASPGRTLAVARYIERNPEGCLVQQPQDWPHSSARAHLLGQDDGIVEAVPLLELEPDWSEVILKPWPSANEYTPPHRKRRHSKQDAEWGPVPLLDPS
jgi:putative transposase